MHQCRINELRFFGSAGNIPMSYTEKNGFGFNMQ